MPSLAGRTTALIRMLLYFSCLVWGVGVIFFSIAAYMAYPDSNPPKTDSKRPKNDPVLIELLVCVGVTGIWAYRIMGQIWYQNSTSRSAKNWVELTGLGILWVAWTVGVFASAILLPQFVLAASPRGLTMLRVLLAFAWMEWLAVMLLFFPSLLIVSKYRSWNVHHYDTWGHRTYFNQTQRGEEERQRRANGG